MNLTTIYQRMPRTIPASKITLGMQLIVTDTKTGYTHEHPAQALVIPGTVVTVQEIEECPENCMNDCCGLCITTAVKDILVTTCFRNFKTLNNELVVADSRNHYE